MAYDSFGDPEFDLKNYIGTADISRTFRINWDGDHDAKIEAEKYAASLGIQTQRDTPSGTIVTASPVKIKVLMDKYDMNVQEIMG